VFCPPVSTYGDIYHEPQPAKLWPGTGMPGLGFAFYSRMLASARPHLVKPPPVFIDEGGTVVTPDPALVAIGSLWMTDDDSRE
jgi:hypothetical protein